MGPTNLAVFAERSNADNSGIQDELNSDGLIREWVGPTNLTVSVTEKRFGRSVRLPGQWRQGRYCPTPPVSDALSGNTLWTTK